MIKLTIKDLKLFLKDRRSLLLTFAIPIALITLFAFAFGGVGKEEAGAKITLLISDLDNTKASEAAIKQLDSLSSIQTKQIKLKEAEKLIKSGKESSVLIFYKGFSDSLVTGNDLPLELKYDEAKEIEVGLLQQALIPTLSMLPFSTENSNEVLGKKLIKSNGIEDIESQQNVQTQSDGLFKAISDGISKSNRDKDKSTNPTSAFFSQNLKMTKLLKAKNDNQLGLVQAVAGTAVMMLLFSVAGIGMGLLDEKQEGTLKRLIYSPMKPVNILLGKMISANIISVSQLIVMFLFAKVVFGLDIAPHLPELLLTIIATAFACSAFGVLIASLAQKREQIQGLSTLIILVMSAIGGSMIPLFFMPVFMQKIAVVSVNYWSIQSFYDIFWRNLSITDPTYLSRIIILFAIGGILNLIAIRLFKRNLLKLT